MGPMSFGQRNETFQREWLGECMKQENPNLMICPNRKSSWGDQLTVTDSFADKNTKALRATLKKISNIKKRRKNKKCKTEKCRQTKKNKKSKGKKIREKNEMRKR